MVLDPNQMQAALESVDSSAWPEYEMEYGRRSIRFRAPEGFTEISMGAVEPLADVPAAVARALAEPIGAPPLGRIVALKGGDPAALTAAITVSDITRPVNYKEPGGILLPILDALLRAGLKRKNIRIVVGTGTHRPSADQEKLEMFGPEIVGRGFSISDHDCEDRELLVDIGRTRSGTRVLVNRLFAEADIRIATGLVESHFMAGVSGGRKAVCPGLVNLETINKFHSPEFLERPAARNLSLDDNPCHREALEVAERVGVDFLVNSAFDKDMRVTGVFAGDLVLAHEAAVKKIRTYVEVPIHGEFDIVATHAGYVGRNHYQAAKAAVGAEPAVKRGGVLILAANNLDCEPVGGPEYRTLIRMLALQGPEGYIRTISAPDWSFTKDQWQPEMWAHPLRKIGPGNLVYCTGDIGPGDLSELPGTPGWAMLSRAEADRPELEAVGLMMEKALKLAVHQHRSLGFEPRTAVIREGPYAVPALKPGS